MKHFPSIFLSLLLPLAVAAQSVQIQDGAIRAEFSVSDSTKVYFSQGNLQYQASTNTWRFAEHQWDYVGTQTPDEDGYYGGTINGSDNANISETYEGWIDLFGWGTSGYNSVYPYSNGNYANAFEGETKDIVGTNYDWGVYNKISNGGNQAGLWRTLTYNEWHYLRHYRTDADALYGTATVNGVDGCIFLPDNWTTPTGVTFKCGANGYSANTYSSSDWSKMEANGAVFLPAAGDRNGTDVYFVGSHGDYWSSSADSYYYTGCLSFDDDRVDKGSGGREIGRSVRLVQDVPSLPLAVAAQSVQIQDGAIRAEFSVSDSTKVYFSQGNLQYQASTNTWRFTKHQWDYVGTQTPDENGYYGGTINGSDNANISETYEGWIDLFGWGTSGYNGKNPYMTSTSYSDYGDGSNDIAGTNYDWGVYNKVSNGGNQAGMWRTLTSSEWNYLISGRAQANRLMGHGRVNNVNGLILLPDSWATETPSSVRFTYDPGNYSTNVYSLDEWAVMQSYGTVFLPAAGYRNGTGVNYVGSYGYYWSSSANDSNFAYYPFFYSNDAYTNYYGSRVNGLSVRLVQDVK